MIKKIQQYWSTTLLGNRSLNALTGVILLFISSYILPFMYPIALGILIITLLLILADWFLLFQQSIQFSGERKHSKVLSLGDENSIRLIIENKSPIPLSTTIIDELPIPLQVRNFNIKTNFKKDQTQTFEYTVRPLSRGSYSFGNTNVICRSLLGLLERRYIVELANEVPVYPSIIQMKKYSIEAVKRIALEHGERKLKQLGSSYEFDQIKNYVRGDDFRNINWKATGKRGELMVNQYTEERSQRIYCILDKSRVMKMPFDGLSLLDYAVNASLVISNVALQKHDKAGLLSFSDAVGSLVPADNSAGQLDKIMRSLYNEQERNLESNYELLYQMVERMVSVRSLLFLFTNFESYYALERVLPLLRRINRKHLLVVIFFENSEMVEYTKTAAVDTKEIFQKTIVEDSINERKKIGMTLRQYGIQTIITKPEDLSIQLINKYLLLKKQNKI